MSFPCLIVEMCVPFSGLRGMDGDGLLDDTPSTACVLINGAGQVVRVGEARAIWWASFSRNCI